MVKYSAYISAIKCGVADTRPVCLEVESPGEALFCVIDDCFNAYPKADGWTHHATSTVFLLLESKKSQASNDRIPEAQTQIPRTQHELGLSCAKVLLAPRRRSHYMRVGIYAAATVILLFSPFPLLQLCGAGAITGLIAEIHKHRFLRKISKLIKELEEAHRSGQITAETAESILCLVIEIELDKKGVK